MPLSNAQKLVKGLSDLGYSIWGTSFHIHRWLGQGMMNKAAGEIAPTWVLLADPLWRFEKVIQNGSNPNVTLPDGEKGKMEICSHIPLSHILKCTPEEWEISVDRVTGTPRLIIDVPDLPEGWK